MKTHYSYRNQELLKSKSGNTPVLLVTLDVIITPGSDNDFWPLGAMDHNGA